MKNIIPLITMAVIITCQQPKHSAYASILWQNKYVNTSLLGYYKGEQYGNNQNTEILDPYFTFNVQLSKQIKEHFILSFAIQDAFDNQYTETGDYLSPGRIINGRLAIKF